MGAAREHAKDPPGEPAGPKNLLLVASKEKAAHEKGVERVSIPNRSAKSADRKKEQKKRWFRVAKGASARSSDALDSIAAGTKATTECTVGLDWASSATTLSTSAATRRGARPNCRSCDSMAGSKSVESRGRLS